MEDIHHVYQLLCIVNKVYIRRLVLCMDGWMDELCYTTITNIRKPAILIESGWCSDYLNRYMPLGGSSYTHFDRSTTTLTMISFETVRSSEYNLYFVLHPFT
ncbi:hypothetical protein M0804_015584 [Polistes exclamans]|nr:hypothetical protein M0804_015585 [Polistes exclamans]KAI4472837.1 hypothetical protein M0804_015584 [Polistes exclamans]